MTNEHWSELQMRMNRETTIICGNLSHLRNLRAVWGEGLFNVNR